MLRALALLAFVPLAACQPVALALLGAGATSAVRYNLDGIAARTFTAPAANVRSASLGALQRMGIELGSSSTSDTSETIYARAARRDIEIELEPISPRATRVRVTARDDSSIFYDTATALEIVQQTERLLAASETKSTSGGTRATTLSEN